MIGDKVLLEPIHHKKADLILPKVDKEDVILIFGYPGAGKTEVAHSLSEKLSEKEISSLIISLDDHYFTNWQTRNCMRQKMGIHSVGLQEIDWHSVVSIIKEFK